MHEPSLLAHGLLPCVCMWLFLRFGVGNFRELTLLDPVALLRSNTEF